ncbi:MAG: SDR family NAD(P)-dependent oxidoreductase, partial [Chitinophagaceae bacterium]
PWTVLNNKPRLAGISSFGAGGSNAHIIIEEYQTRQQASYNVNEPPIIVLSARTMDSLKQQAINLKNFIALHAHTNIHDIAYTLQTGREAMEERLGLVAGNLEELTRSLNTYLEGKEAANIFTGSIKKDKSVFLLEGKAGHAYIATAIEHKEGKSLIQLWVKGVNIDWTLLYGEHKPQKISLPTYPFARESYWIAKQPGTTLKATEQLHPLLHRNDSDLSEQKYSSLYSGAENFLAHHKVNGQKILPGVAYLELAREAGTLALNQKVTQLKDVTWLSPLQVNGKAEKVNIRLSPSHEQVSYEVYTHSNEQEVLHSQGTLSTEPAKAEQYDIASIQQRLSNTKTGAECYSLFEKIGLQYGSSFQGIEKLYYSKEEALSRISVAAQQEYILPPGLLDSSLQTCLGLQLEEDMPALSLPYSVSEVNIYAALPERLWCYARKSKNNNDNRQVISYDIDLLDDAGQVLLSFKELLVLPLNGLLKAPPPANIQADAISTHFYNSTWQAAPLTTAPVAVQSATALILLAGAPVGVADKLKEILELEVELLVAGNEETYFLAVLEKVRQKMAEKKPAHIMVVCLNQDYLDYSFVSGILKAAAHEKPSVTGKIIGVESMTIADTAVLASLLQSELGTMDAEVRYHQGQRQVKTIMPLRINKPASSSIKPGGVYLITGGTGTLGLLFAEHIGKISGTTVVLTGRKKLSEALQQRLSVLPNTVYYQCDITSEAEVTMLIHTIKIQYSKLDGIIHSAAVLHDSFIFKKTAAEAAEVLAPKIAGVKNLDRATREDALDFMLLFSSVSGILSTVGQADYS